MTSPYNNLGCGGGDPYMAYYYIYNNKGVDTSACYPVSIMLELPQIYEYSFSNDFYQKALSYHSRALLFPALSFGFASVRKRCGTSNGSKSLKKLYIF